jgi:hypothetical protein
MGFCLELSFTNVGPEARACAGGSSLLRTCLRRSPEASQHLPQTLPHVRSTSAPGSAPKRGSRSPVRMRLLASSQRFCSSAGRAEGPEVARVRRPMELPATDAAHKHERLTSKVRRGVGELPAFTMFHGGSPWRVDLFPGARCGEVRRVATRRLLSGNKTARRR